MDGALANFPLTWFWLLQLCFVFLPHPLAFWKKKQSKLVPKVVFFVVWTHIWEEPLQGSILEANLTKNPSSFWHPFLLHFQKMCSVFLRYFFGRSTSRDWGISRSKKASILGPKCIPKFDMPDLQICCYLLHFDTILTSEGASKSVQILLRKQFANLLLQNVDLDGFRGSFQDPFWLLFDLISMLRKMLFFWTPMTRVAKGQNGLTGELKEAT